MLETTPLLNWHLSLNFYNAPGQEKIMNCGCPAMHEREDSQWWIQNLLKGGGEYNWRVQSARTQNFDHIHK